MCKWSSPARGTGWATVQTAPMAADPLRASPGSFTQADWRNDDNAVLVLESFSLN